MTTAIDDVLLRDGPAEGPVLVLAGWRRRMVGRGGEFLLAG